MLVTTDQVRLISVSPAVAVGLAGAAGTVTAVVEVDVLVAVFTEFFGRTASVYEVPSVRPMKVYEVASAASVSTTVPFLRTSTPVTGAAVVEVAAVQVIPIVLSPTDEPRPAMIAGVPSGVAESFVERAPSPAGP